VHVPSPWLKTVSTAVIQIDRVKFTRPGAGRDDQSNLRQTSRPLGERHNHSQIRVLMHQRKAHKCSICGAEVFDLPMPVLQHQMSHVRRRDRFRAAQLLVAERRTRSRKPKQI